MDKKKQQTEHNNWQSTNIGIVIMAIIFLMPFGLILLAMLTFGKNINLSQMFKGFWQRMTQGTKFEQPNLWGNGNTKYRHKNNAYNQYRREQDADFMAEQSQKRADLIKQEQAFNDYQKYKKTAEDKAEFEAFRAS